MSDLAEIALEFCRECLGWDNAFHSGDGYIVSRGKTPQDARVWSPQDTNDLNAVMDAVNDHCDRLEIQTCDLEPRWHVAVWINAEDKGKGWIKGQKRNDNLCHALLAACVEAARILKAAV